ncbi:MAG TPA: NAD-dependent epimerase/dehydratase family protein [Thermoleophilaceae bacterium]|nr:NAD-dependent epimerase/dehydratase family protein [Thermoleophilaceae bacterium]
MRIVVTGAAGFIGSHLSERLLAAGHEVRGLDSFTRFYARAHKEANLAAAHRAPGFTLYEDTASTPEGLARAFTGADAVCHLAGRPGVRGGAPHAFEEANVRTTESVLSAASAAGARRVILASSSSVYGPAAVPVTEDAPLRPLSHYGRSKLRAERVAGRKAERLGLDLVTLRYFTVYGPRQRPDMAFARYAAAALEDGQMAVLGDGRQTRDFTYVTDVCDATVAALERGRPGATYNVSGGRPATLDEALTLLARSLGAAARLTPAAADGREPRSTAADLARARDELGWEPAVGLAEGLDHQAAHARATALAV